MTTVPLLASVELITDIPGKGLNRGQMGTVVEFLRNDGEDALLVEFSDEDGETYAMEALKPEQLLLLHRSRNEAA